MTEGNLYYQEFLTVIRQKIPHKATLVNTITDLLDIDKDAVYRRLRGEVSFSFTEMATIAKKLGVSLDSIAEIESVQSKPTQVIMTRHVNPTDLDYRMFNDHVNLLKFVKDEPETKIIESGNMLPHYIFYDFEHFTRFYIFCWNQASCLGAPMQFSEIVIPKEMRELQKKCCQYARSIKHTEYVWDRMIINRFVSDVKFFAKVRLLKEEDVSLIKADLIELVNKIEIIATKGKHEETGTEALIYISDINIETNYSCLVSKNLNISLFRTFLLNSNAALDKDVFTEVHSWISALQRMSTLISVSGEIIRNEFFSKQREIINTL